MPEARLTRIIATLGPATDSPDQIAALVAAGVDVFRLNMSHASHAWVRECVRLIREATESAGRHCGILMDVMGPSIRTGTLPESIPLKAGDPIEFRIESADPTLANSTTVNYGDLPNDVRPGDRMVVDNGLLIVRIDATTPERVTGTVLTDGSLGSRRHINLPGVALNLPAMTGKDREDAALAAELQLDFLALSFVRDMSHIDEVRAFLAARGHSPRIVAKIEDQQAVRNLNGIIQASDAIMVARGDLGIEVPFEELPIIQRRIVKKCHVLGRPVIVATHMLESMTENPTPTRAEVSDVANAVFEQADAIMLSGETSTGKYPLPCIEALDRIARRIEASGGAGYEAQAMLSSDKQLTCQSAVLLANSLERGVLVVFTKRGLMARHLSHLRPKNPIYALAADPRVCRSLALCRGVHPLVFGISPDPEDTILNAATFLKARGLVSDGDRMVIVSDMLQTEAVVDAILLRTA